MPVSFSEISLTRGRVFIPPNLLQIAMPLGGIGAGCVALNGYGGLQDFSIRHQPDTTALPDTHGVLDAAFALLRMLPKGGEPITRLVEGPFPSEKIYDQALKGQGYRGGGFEGLPRFRECVFLGEYPFGQVTLTDPALPIKAQITGFNPFIPLDDRNSSLPCAILEYRLENTSTQPVKVEFSYHLSHLAPGDPARNWGNSRNQVISGHGVFMHNVDDPRAPSFGSCALAVNARPSAIKAMWYRGGWFDAMSALWREGSEGRLRGNDGGNAAEMQGRNGGSVLIEAVLQPGESVTIPVVIAWHFPNVPWGVGMAQPTDCACGEGEFCDPCWRPYYTSQWADAREVAEYVLSHYDQLRARTLAFHHALFRSTLPDEVIEAISANLAILKSPTVLRQENGNIWGWEGCFSGQGCCHGTCTHVWNYAQAMPHLFPALERTLREQELLRSMDAEGHITFRAALPDGPAPHTFHAAADGQLGGVMKVFREWQISGDLDWLERLYPAVKQSMDWSIAHWDPKEEGLVVEPHHNTYDIEFWGPDGMISSFYLGALTAMHAMSVAVGDVESAPRYLNLAEKGAQAIESLFNGEYYQQNVRWDDLRDQSLAQKMASINAQSSEEDHLLLKEGPKYQYGAGCLADGVLGAWLARRCQVNSPQNQEHVRQALHSIFRYNFRESLWDHANMQRAGYAMGEESGLLLCTWPHGGKPTFPFPYSDEVWTGFEYQVASHMIEMGWIEDGLRVVKSARSRSDGHTRNPWNEYECGNYYARAMSSYALLEACSGLRYSAVTHALAVEPRLDQEFLTTFFCTAHGWGTICLSQGALTIEMAEGELVLSNLIVKFGGQSWQKSLSLTVQTGNPLTLSL